jgi:hypothetical protein
MPGRAHAPAITALLLTLGGVAFGGGCALVYDYTGYVAASTGTGTSSGAGTGGTGATTGSEGTGGASSSGSGAGGSGGALPAAPWSRRFGDTKSDVAGAPGLDVSPAGDAVFITGDFVEKISLGGASEALTSANTGVFLAKLSAATGDTLWSTSVADTMSEVPALAATPDGGVVVAHSFDVSARLVNSVVPTAGMHDILLAKYGGDGAEVWATRFGDAADQLVHAVAVDAMGRIYVTGEFSGGLDLGSVCGTIGASASGFNNGFIAQLSSEGACVWATTFGDRAYGSSLSTAGGVVALGGAITGQTSFGPVKIGSALMKSSFVASFDALGTLGFAVSVPGDDVYLVMEPTQHHVFVGTTLPIPNAPDMNITELDASGSLVWSKSYGGPGVDHLASIARSGNGDLLISGDSTGALDIGPTKATNHGFQDLFVARISAAGAGLGCVEFGDDQPQLGRNVRFDAKGHAFVYGDFKGSIDFGTGKLTSAGDFDVALARILVP